jgi:asparagine synthase (glutamine-hydrolysing)
MCGIWCFFHSNNSKTIPLTSPDLLKNRGPDETVITIMNRIVLGFTHLRINGWTLQPMNVGKWWILCNGEIFNHTDLEKETGINPPKNTSDCWFLPYMIDKFGLEYTVKKLDGEFAIVAYNSESNTLYATRDLFGIKPLFYGKTEDGIYLSSEIKGLDCDASWVQPGTIITFDNKFNHSIKFFNPRFFNKVETSELSYQIMIRESLIHAVKKRCMSDKPVAALLSGGLDSSIICAILSKIVPELHTFSVGMADSPDLKHARLVARYIGSNHHELILNPIDFKNAVFDVIKDIESYDITTVRASVGNWLLGKYIKETTDFKVIFNGDGSDELLGGYLYFQKAPSDEEFEHEIDRLLDEIHMFDVLRSERCMAAHGLESRTPYLDIDFVKVCRSMPTKYLRNKDIEKYMLRQAFAKCLPPEIINRKKEAFSDGVSLVPWFKRDDEKEYYSDTFSLFYKQRIIPHMWMPRWSPETTDPSARTLSNYKN